MSDIQSGLILLGTLVLLLPVRVSIGVAMLIVGAGGYLGHWRGGIAMSAVGACAAFRAICASSLATAATMGKTQ